MSDLTNENESLAEEIEKPLPVSKKRKVTDLEVDTDEEEQEILENGISDQTRQKIYTILRDITKDEVNASEKMLDIINKINHFTEEQARVYFEMLSFAHSHKMNSALAKRAIHLLASYCVHKDDPFSIDEMKDDIHIMSSLTNFFGFIFARMGNISGLLIFTTYIFYSHYVYGKKTITQAPFQDDGKCPEPNGEDNPHGEINEDRLGK